MTEATLVHLNQVCLAFDGKSVLNGVELKIFPQDRLVILGQSGGGKSTMLRLILGILKPTSGEMKYKHLRVSRLSRSKLNLLRSRIGMVYQYSALISSLNVRDNLALPVQELGRKSESEIDALVEEKLSMVGMSGTESKLPSELSGGLGEADSLTRALMLDPGLDHLGPPPPGPDPVMGSLSDELHRNLTPKTTRTSVI